MFTPTANIDYNNKRISISYHYKDDEKVGELISELAQRLPDFVDYNITFIIHRPAMLSDKYCSQYDDPTIQNIFDTIHEC